jgi:hypothetical protein
MSYSFSVKAASKVEAVAKVAEQMASVVAAQPSHATDHDAAVAAAGAFIGLLVEPTAGQCVSVSMYGSLGWREPGEYTSGNVSVSVSVIAADA